MILIADQQIGSIIGVAANGGQPALSAITADGVNTVTVSDTSKIVVGSFIDLINGTTGAVLASNRQVTALSSAGLLTYGGADVTAVAGTTVVVPTGAGLTSTPANTNGGGSPQRGFELDALDSIADMRARLTAAGGIYTTTYLNMMTFNDCVYAIRLLEAPATVR